MKIILSIVLTCLWIGCQFGDNSIPAPDDSGIDASNHPLGWDPEISRCCDWFYKPWVESPQACLDEHTDSGECRWLKCLGGIVKYHTTGCPVRIAPIEPYSAECNNGLMP